jgi:hypothetical protein
MNKAIAWIVIVAIALGVGWYWWQQRTADELEAVDLLPPLAGEPVEPEIRHPVTAIPVPVPVDQQPAPEPPPPLPALENSDEEVRAAAAGLVGEDEMAQHVVGEQVVNRLVATIDSLTSARLAPLMLPWKTLPGTFKAMQSEDQAAISPANAQRYDAIVGLVSGVDSQALVRTYVRYYPLFQQSYEAQGYPDGYFNDRLVAVIDHLLETPAPTETMDLVSSEAVYKFADPALEALSAGQKMLLRAGPAHYAVLTAKLREIRGLIASGVPGQP